LNIIRPVAVIAGGLLAFFVLALAWVWAAPCALGGCAPLDELAEYQAEGSELLDVNGEPFARLATVNRRIVPIDSLPPHLPHAFLAVEDQRFYKHSGLDFRRLVGAALSNLRLGRVAEGGSTISQQLARNLFPDWLPFQERNLRRKVLEARVARQIEREFDKDKILELYLNHIYLGSGAYGVEAAALAYFGKPASELTIAESAMLGGLPQAPSRINPRENLERATERRDLVLNQMVRGGYITAAEGEEAKAEAVSLADGRRDPDAPRSSYFVERVRLELEETVGARFYTAGLKIHTTLDPVAQRAAEEELERQLGAIEAGRFGAYRHARYSPEGSAGERSPYLQGAVILLDAESGGVRALVGGRDFADSKFDRATQAIRQPGSAFKPIIYLNGLQRYGSPAHTLEDTPLRLVLSGGRAWEPRNYGGQYDGTITMRDALARSKNTATVRLAQDVGMSSVVRTARTLGITSDIPNVPATALGAADVRPIEMIAAYAPFANGGYTVQPHLIRRVEDRHGRVLWEARPSRSQVIDPAVAFVLTSMLRDVIDRGTGAAVRAVGFGAPAAGKTGTTNEATDVWFIGYTPDLVGGVWIGMDEPATIVPGASGGTLAAPAWGRIMRRVYENRPAPAEWRQPSGVTTAQVDRATGALVSEACPPRGAVFTEFFVGSARVPRLCPAEYEPRLALSDTGWVDEEWGDLDPMLEPIEPYGDDQASQGVDWPELEALRRRIRRAQEEFESSREMPGTETEDRDRQDDRPEPQAPRTPGDPTPTQPPPPPPPPSPADEEEERDEPRVLGVPAPQGARPPP
jgi:penicillin-binding protein 1A